VRDREREEAGVSNAEAEFYTDKPSPEETGPQGVFKCNMYRI